MSWAEQGEERQSTGEILGGLERLGMSRAALKAAIEGALDERGVPGGSAVADAVAEAIVLNNREIWRQLLGARRPEERSEG